MNNHVIPGWGRRRTQRILTVLALLMALVALGSGPAAPKPSAGTTGTRVSSYDSAHASAECYIDPCDVAVAYAERTTGVARSHLEVAPPPGKGAWAVSTIMFGWSAKAGVGSATTVTWTVHIARAELVQPLGAAGRPEARSITATARAFRGTHALCRTESTQPFPAGTTTIDPVTQQMTTVIEDVTVELTATCSSPEAVKSSAFYGQVIIRDSVSGGTLSRTRSTYDLRLQSITVR